MKTVFAEHLYIHWPFCKNKCHYCDFVAFEKHGNYAEQYHRALCREITEAAGAQDVSGYAKTLFMGGGTPSLYPLNLLPELFTALATYADISDLHEATIEVNPGALDEQHIQVWRACGINRLSIGVQVLDDQVLRKLNRHQTVADSMELINLASNTFSNISVDLILGLPGVTTDVWWRTLETVVSWPITHISIYFLMIHENTPLYHRVMRGSVRPMRDDVMVDLYEQTVAFCARHGFMQYEISNFARPGYESLHNRAYWDRKPYRGFGLSAASFDGRARSVNDKNLQRYLDCWTKEGVRDDGIGTRGGAFYEVLTPEQVYLERLMLGIRQVQGIALRDLEAWWGDDAAVQRERLEQLKAAKLIIERNGAIQLTTRGMALENEVISTL